MPPCASSTIMTPSSPTQADQVGRSSTTMSSAANNMNNNNSQQKYHALIIDSGAIIKQTSLSSFTSNTSTSNNLLNAAKHYYTVPAVLTEIRDTKSRQHLQNFQQMLKSIHNTELITRSPSKEGIEYIINFSKKTGDYNQLSNVDIQVLALLYDVEVECANLYNSEGSVNYEGRLNHIRSEPKRVLGVSVKALNGDGKREIKKIDKSNSVSGGGSVVDSSSSVTSSSVVSNTAFFSGNGIIDASNVDFEDDDDEEDDNGEDRVIVDTLHDPEDRQDITSIHTDTGSSSQAPKKNTWATLVNPTKASNGPLVDYTIGNVSATSSNVKNENNTVEEESAAVNLEDIKAKDTTVIEAGQFDDASSSSEDEDDTFSTSNEEEDEGILDALNIANATSTDEISDEECDVFILDPHEVVYLKKLKEQKKKDATLSQDEQGNKEEDGVESEFPSLSVAANVPYEGCSDDEEPIEFDAPPKSTADQAAWEASEEERKKKALQPMVNGRIVKSEKAQGVRNPFRKYGNVVSEKGAAVAMKQQQKIEEEKEEVPDLVPVDEDDTKEDSTAPPSSNGNSQAYTSRISGAANAALASSSNADGHPTSEMTADDDDGEGWVTCTRDIQTMKATGSLHLDNNRHFKNNKRGTKNKNAGPPISQRAACATTDFAMQNVILQMNLELLSVDGVRVRRLKTWVTRCGACFTIYGNDHGNKSSGGGNSGRLFCDKCGSNTLQRIAASVDRDTGRLKLHMKKNYQYNTRGTKFSLPKAGKGNKYEGDILLAEDQLLYGAWNQKVRKGKSKSSGQSIFGSDLASDMGCITDLTKRDDIRVGFGRRNPNSTKFGRERRGKKKKGTKDKACGLRRY